MTVPIFYVRRGDRLISRLKHLLYAWRFAKQVGGKTIVVWPPPGVWKRFDGMDYSPSLIFDVQQMAAEEYTQDLEFRETSETFPSGFRSLEEPEFARWRNNSFDREYFKKDGLVFHEANLMHYRFTDEVRTRSAANKEVGALFARLPLHPAITDMLRRIDDDLGGAPLVCLHARAGDVFHMLQSELPQIRNGKLDEKQLKRLIGHYVVRTAPLELYEPWVRQAIDSQMKIVFSSDSPEQIEWFKQKYGSHHFFDLAEYQVEFPIQKALLDFAVLVKSVKLLGTRSNFSSFACDLGGGEHVIVSATTRTPLSEEKVVKLYVDQAFAKFLPGETAETTAGKIVAQEISRHYKFINRLGTKEEIQKLDPRKPSS